MLRINCYGFAAGEFFKVNAMTSAAKSKFNPVMHETLLFQTVADTSFIQKVDSILFQDTGAHALFDILPVVQFQNDGLNPRQVKKMRKHQPGRARAYNPHLRAHSSLADLRFCHYAGTKCSALLCC